MGTHTHRKASGTFYTSSDTGRPEEGVTVSCVHCQHMWIYRPGSGTLRGYCQRCMGYICGAGCMECVPWEKQCENIEAGRDPTDCGPIKVYVPPGIR